MNRIYVTTSSKKLNTKNYGTRNTRHTRLDISRNKHSRISFDCEEEKQKLSHSKKTITEIARIKRKKKKDD